jgi:tyrosine-specific transport protein
MPVVWTSLLITSNTVGAGMLVLPELCQGPGMGVSMGLFLGMYFVNLLSGLLISEVAITQKERSGKDAPSSFKAFAEENFDNSPEAKHIIAGVSVIKNALVLAFGTMKAGQFGHDIFGLNPDVLSIVWAIAFAVLVGTQSAPKLSKVASVFVAGLFSSFCAILIPGLAHLQAPMGEILTTPGTSADPLADLIHAAPIILMSFIFQNIVPTAARILDYDRTKIALSMGIGTLFPFAMYTVWCLAVLGGGVDTAVGMEGPLVTIFSVVTIAGSHLGSSTSIAEELDTYLRSSSSSSEEEDRKNDVFSWESVAITAALAIGLGEGFAGNLNDLLSIAGAYGSPLLYFVLPVAMVWNQQQQQQQPPQKQEQLLQAQAQEKKWAIPTIPLAISASAAAGFVGKEVFHLM